MRQIIETKRFQKDLKRQKKRGGDLERLAQGIVELLAKSGSLPRQFKPHPLTGEWKGVWDCHIEPDWLLLYDVSQTEVILFRTGTHSDLFD